MGLCFFLYITSITELDIQQHMWESNHLIDTWIYSANLVLVTANIVAHDGRPSAGAVVNTNASHGFFIMSL